MHAAALRALARLRASRRRPLESRKPALFLSLLGGSSKTHSLADEGGRAVFKDGCRRFASSAGSRDLGADSFLTGTSGAYVEQMFLAWKNDPASVHASWAAYFSALEKGTPPQAAFQAPPSLLPGGVWAGAFSRSLPEGQGPAKGASAGEAFCGAVSPQSVHDTSRLIQMVRGFQTRGHELAKTNPLSLPRRPPFCSERGAESPLSLGPEAFGFTPADLDRVYDCRVPGMEGFLSPDFPRMPLSDLVKRLHETYCGSLGVEYMHIADSRVCNFLRQRLETPRRFEFSPERKRQILVRTARAQLFENFCASKFTTTKRFGLDGCEALIVGLKAITKKAALGGVESVVMGMAHRGRLNVLVNVMHKPMQQLMSEFQGVSGYGGSEWGNTGDVKYHLGVEFDLFDADSKRHIHMGVLPNPSHLEAVAPLVLGQTRAQQYFRGDANRTLVLPLIVHGDASVAGQGVVYETLQMSQLPHYRVGGAVHVVVNNQLGFTTNPVDAGSGKYCTDVAKAIEAPVLHVNADDPEAVTFACELALEFRQRFHRDVFVDIVGYRRFGHNELDMPKFTQPQTYNLIAKKKTVLEVYGEKLKAEGVVTEEDISSLKDDIWQFYDREYEKSKTFTPTHQCKYAPQWKHLVTPDHPAPPRITGVPEDTLRSLGKRIFSLPETFTPHPTIGRVFRQWLSAMEGEASDRALDFGACENLAYASLLSDGFHVRVAGQDSQRGTFSHRHAVVHDQSVQAAYSIFDSLAPLQLPHKIEVCNSLLSEYGAMGFEFGYALEHPDILPVWEAQFGDFSNGAQIVIDQFLVAAETKWNRQCGLVLLLPHGYDGLGPEHSSGRIERFLQLCDDREDVIHEENWELSRSSVIQQHNIQVVVPTLPASLFHVLRRQVHREFRKPLVVFSPKRLLRLRAAMSALQDISQGTRFRRYIADDQVKEPAKVERLVLCSGQVYFDLHTERERLLSANPEGPGSKVAIARVEQLSPFPFDLLIEDLKKMPNLKSVVWAQEEPMNQGAWFYTSKRIINCLRYLGSPNGVSECIYAGRDVSATTAVGDKKLHDAEVARLLADAFDLEKNENSYKWKYTSKMQTAAK